MNHVARWNWEEFEVPDVVGFADYVASAAEWTGRFIDSDSCEGLCVFPWNDGGKLRQLSVLGCRDLVAYSSASARIASKTDRQLSPRVYSCLLNVGPPRWTLHPHGKWHAKFRSSSIALLRSGSCSAMRVEDIENYFGSVSLPVLIEFLAKSGCERRAIQTVARLLGTWQCAGLAGLPVGPDASRLLGNALLLPLDLAIRSLGVEHRRWMDDSLVFGETIGECGEAVDAARDALSRLRLKFSAKKSLIFEDRKEAIAHIQERLIASLTSLRDDPTHFLEAVQEAWVESAADVAHFMRRQFRWLLRRLSEKGSRIAVRDLVAARDLANIDARVPATICWLWAGLLTAMHTSP